MKNHFLGKLFRETDQFPISVGEYVCRVKFRALHGHFVQADFYL